MDPLGQGISKDDSGIFFCKKTLPLEEGRAFVYKKSKGVHFCTLKSVKELTKTSEKRITPECVHFKECPSCHYLHTDYGTEISFKVLALSELFKKLSTREDLKQIDPKRIQTISAPHRLGYRNRLQLHYNLKRELLGQIDPTTKTILEIPKCLIADPKILSALTELYQNKSWIKEAKKYRQNTGHVELYLRTGNEKVQLSWNKDYAFGGFDQVNEQMNHKLCELLTKEVRAEASDGTILDLFGGSGNLTKELSEFSTLIVDTFTDNDLLQDHQYSLSLSLDSEEALDEVEKALDTGHIHSLILDPPRRGFKQIGTWVQKFAPDKLFYVSCHPASLVRDLSYLPANYQLSKLYLLDLFPGTFHFETMAVFSEKKMP